MQIAMWLLPTQWAFAGQSGQGGSTHSSSSPHARWSGQSASVMHSERLDVNAKWWIQLIKSTLLTIWIAAFITWVTSANAYMIASFTLSICCTVWTWWIYTLFIFSTCKVIRAMWVSYAFCKLVEEKWCIQMIKIGFTYVCSHPDKDLLWDNQYCRYKCLCDCFLYN